MASEWRSAVNPIEYAGRIAKTARAYIHATINLVGTKPVLVNDSTSSHSDARVLILRFPVLYCAACNTQTCQDKEGVCKFLDTLPDYPTKDHKLYVVGVSCGDNHPTDGPAVVCSHGMYGDPVMME